MDHPLRLYRKANNLSLEAISASLDVTPVQVSRIETGERGCSPAMAKKIDEATNGAVPRWQLRPDLWDAPASTEVAA